MANMNDDRPEGAPDNPEFWKLSAAVLKQDGAIEAAESMEEVSEVFDTLLAEANVSHENLSYMAEQRAYRLLGITTPDEAERQARIIGALAATFVDGFIAGSTYTREG